MRPSQLLALVVAALLASCGGSTPTATFSGAVNGSLNVLASGAGGDGAPTDGGLPGPSGVAVRIVNSGLNPLSAIFQSSIGIGGTSLETGTFTTANTLGAYTSLEIDPAGAGITASWAQNFQVSEPSSETSTFSLAISSVGSVNSSTSTLDGNVTEWQNPLGSFFATLPATFGSATGSLTVNVTF
jgi:hypothetical protein